MGTREILNVLVTADYPPDALQRLAHAFSPGQILQVAGDDREGIELALEHADVAVLGGDLDRRFIEAPRLGWIHCDHSGLNSSATPELFARKDLVVTGSAGRNAIGLAQHVFYFALSLAYEAPRLLAAQQARRWTGLADYSDPWALWGKTIGVIGTGHTGAEVAKLGQAFGMRTVGYGRHVVDHLDAFYPSGEAGALDALLSESDFVVLCIRLSDETHHLIGDAQLRAMKETAYLINISRGAVVDENALVTALTAGRIRGAGLDVFEREPLPQDAPVWGAPNVLITSHTTLRMPDMLDRSLAIIGENAKRYRCGEPLVNVLKYSDLYTRSQ